MKKSDIILCILIGVIAGSLVTFLYINNQNNEDKKATYTEKVNSDEKDKGDPLVYLEDTLNSKDNNVIKNGFIKVVDFLFYDEPINGVKFSELSNSAKLKVLELALSIDKKIDDVFPDYKETISEKYNGLKSKIVNLYIDLTTNICSNNEDLCSEAKEKFSYIKATFDLSLDFLKSLGSDALEKLKLWYEDFRD